MQAEKETLKQTIILGVFFVLLVTTYTSFSNIITFIFENDSKEYPFTGTLSLILNYVVYLFGLTWAASLTNFKRQFQIAAICYTVNYALYLVDLSQLFRLIISIIGAIVGGYGASVLWVSQGGYMVKLFKVKGIEQAAQGKYIGVMNGIVFSHIALAGLLTTFGLGLFGNQVYFIILSVIGIVSYFLCKLMLDPLQENSTTVVTHEVKSTSFVNELKQIIFYYPKMKYVIFAMILDGFLTAFIATNFSDFLPVPFKTNFNVGLLHISNGIGAIFGGYLSGWLSDKIPALKEGVILFTFTTLVLLLTTLTSLLKIQTMTFPLIITFLWGIVFSFLQGWLFVCCVKVNKGETQSFAVVKQMHTLSFIVFQIYVIITGGKINFFGTIIVLLLLAVISGVICFAVSIKNPKSEQLCQEKINEDSPPNHNE